MALIHSPYESLTRTPWATMHDPCGRVWMTHETYVMQMERAGSLWRCVRCNEVAAWDDDNYEASMEEPADGD